MDRFCHYQPVIPELSRIDPPPRILWRSTHADSRDAQATDCPAGILVTGLVMGLESNPTHEVVKALQNSRKDGPTALLTTTPRTSNVGADDEVRPSRSSA